MATAAVLVSSKYMCATCYLADRLTPDWDSDFAQFSNSLIDDEVGGIFLAEHGAMVGVAYS